MESFGFQRTGKLADLRVIHGNQRALEQTLVGTGGTSTGPGNMVPSTWSHKVERGLWSMGVEVQFERMLDGEHPMLLPSSSCHYKTLRMTAQ